MKSAQFNALIDAAREKDGDAIIILEKFCVKVLTFHIIRQFRDINRAEDWARDIFAYNILSNLPTEKISKPVGWLYKIADNYVINVLKKYKGGDEEYIDNLEGSATFPDFSNKFLLEDTEKIIGKTNSLILFMKHGLRYKYKEIAKHVGLSEDAVRQRASRAIKDLKNSSQFKEIYCHNRY